MITPRELRTQLPRSSQADNTISQARRSFAHILQKKEDRFVVIVGPCSLHNTQSALVYAEKLQRKIEQHRDTLCIIMRAYIEKSRTSTGWKGFVNDPDLNNTYHLEKGLYQARSLLIALNELDVPVAAEIVNPLTAPYFVDLFSFAAIGARTTESQFHREFVSTLSMPVGFKNNTSGNIQVAIDAVATAQNPHRFLGLDLSGKMTDIHAAGNPLCHVILRGAQTHTNFDAKTVQNTAEKLQKLNLNARILIDCSHGNSQSDYRQQKNVLFALQQRLMAGDQQVFGVMLESHLLPGKQTWHPDHPMQPDQSITDACMGWEETEMALDELSVAVEMFRDRTRISRTVSLLTQT